MPDYDYSSIDMIVCALCADYDRRGDHIANKDLPSNVIMEYRYYNTKIFNAVAEIVGDRDAESYIEDIGKRRGYTKRASPIFISENTYIKKKRECKLNIARALKFLA